jgi:hypothetical protein
MTYTVRSENGRQVATETSAAGTVEVAAGYDINEDKFRYHVYVTGRTGEREKLPVGVPFASTLTEAFEEGMTVGRLSIPD